MCFSSYGYALFAVHFVVELELARLVDDENVLVAGSSGYVVCDDHFCVLFGAQSEVFKLSGLFVLLVRDVAEGLFSLHYEIGDKSGVLDCGHFLRVFGEVLYGDAY